MVKTKALLYLSETREPASLSSLLMAAGCTYFQAYIAMEQLWKEGLVEKESFNFRKVYKLVNGEPKILAMTNLEFVEKYLRFYAEEISKTSKFDKDELKQHFGGLFNKIDRKKAILNFSHRLNTLLQTGVLFKKSNYLSFDSKEFVIVENGLSITEVEVPVEKPEIPNHHRGPSNKPMSKRTPNSDRYKIEARVLRNWDRERIRKYKMFWTIASLLSVYLKGKRFSVDHALSVVEYKEEAINISNLQILTQEDNMEKNDKSWPRMSLGAQKDYIRKAVIKNRGKLSEDEMKSLEWAMESLDVLFKEEMQ